MSIPLTFLIMNIEYVVVISKQNKNIIFQGSTNSFSCKLYCFIHKYLDDKLWTQNLRHLLGGLKIEPMTEPNLKLSLFVKCFESESIGSANNLQYLSPKSQI